jgi:hypothetical protein
MNQYIKEYVLNAEQKYYINQKLDMILQLKEIVYVHYAVVLGLKD